MKLSELYGLEIRLLNISNARKNAEWLCRMRNSKNHPKNNFFKLQKNNFSRSRNGIQIAVKKAGIRITTNSIYILSIHKN